MFSIYLDKYNPDNSVLMVGTYDPEGSSYFHDLSIVQCKSAEDFEVEFKEIRMFGNQLTSIRAKDFIIDPQESFITMDFYDLSKVEAAMKTYFSGKGFKC